MQQQQQQRQPEAAIVLPGICDCFCLSTLLAWLRSFIIGGNDTRRAPPSSRSSAFTTRAVYEAPQVVTPGLSFSLGAGTGAGAGAGADTERGRLLPEGGKMSHSGSRELEGVQAGQLPKVGSFNNLRKGRKGFSSSLSLEGDDDDFCPTCLEPYTLHNPKIITNCNHHFHLSCIYEWLERSNTCPVCFQPMNFDELT